MLIGQNLPFPYATPWPDLLQIFNNLQKDYTSAFKERYNDRGTLIVAIDGDIVRIWMLIRSKKMPFLSLLLLVLALAGTLTGCVGAGGSKTNQLSSSTDSTSPVNPPAASSNYFQKAGTTAANIKIESDYQGILYLRGTEVHRYIKNNFSIVSCSLATFQVSGSERTLITAYRPKRFYNTQTNTEEYQYLLEPNNEETNTLLCNTPAIQSILGLSTPVFSLSTLCTNCIDSQLTSAPLKLFSSSGQINNDINTQYLKFTVDLLNNSGDDSTLTCSNNDQCTALGSYDCCSGGICVKNASLKPNATSHPDYLIAIADVAANPNNFIKWPAIYFICETDANGGATPPTPPTPDPGAVDRLTLLKELYQCVNPIQGEMSVCTVRYSNIKSSESYQTGRDDRSFMTTYTGSPSHYVTNTLPMTGHSIFEVIYAGKTLYTNRSFIGGPFFTISGENDSLDSATTISNISFTPPSDAANKDLVIRYTIDGSCSALSASLAKCSKFYTQGQNLAQPDDHFPASNNFKLPKYAAVKRSMMVHVDGHRKQEGVDWELVEGTEPYIRFTSNQLAVFDTQVVKITYYVETDSSQPDKQVLQAKKQAQDTIRGLCQCSDTGYCNLKPVYSLINGITIISDYSCELVDPDAEVLPSLRTEYFSSKAMPHRLFDPAGNPQKTPVPMTITETHSDNSVTTSVSYQEGTLFEYTKGNFLKPNNVERYIGFNEIYGSITGKANSAMPAHEVRVEKDHTYDLYTTTGQYSSCLNCGSDYYSYLSRLFPDSFLGASGGGYNPKLQLSQTNKFKAKYYRADDLKFGRACYVPATMIPWTHNKTSTRQAQRLSRLHAQHFLFANGYQRDWYGFDYGSLIGSFDGVTWFAVGTQRRIKAKSDKLYLAINGAFSDLTESSTFGVKIIDITSSTTTPSMPTEDYETTAAECRNYHVCNSDADCVTQLGWDYVCQDVNGIKTNWPKFDQTSLEIPNNSELQFLRDLIGNIDTSKGTRRCVYRGAGAPCHTNYSSVNEFNSFHRTTSSALSACAPNYHCQSFIQGSALPYFNDRIARFALSVEYKNSSLGTADHTFSLAAPIIGRPYSYMGKTAIPMNEYPINNNFYANNVSAICLPGKDVSSGSQSFEAQHSKRPDIRAQGDKINGIGVTPYIQKADHYLSSCALLDDDGNYLYHQTTMLNKSLNDAAVKKFAGAQATSTNALGAFISLIAENNLTKLFEAEQATSPVLEQNRCLRTAYSPCFSDTDCAPSNFISSRLQEIDETNSDVTAALNQYEIKYWKEELICAQAMRKSDSSYDPKLNRCCREVGKTITIGTYQNQTDTPQFNHSAIPGIDLVINDPARYSRVSTIYKDLKEGTKKPLAAPADDRCSSALGCVDLENTMERQFESFDQVATRTCCTGSWVRNFDKDENGGGHKWGPLKTQKIPKDIFKCLNWNVCSDASGTCGSSSFKCDHVTDPDDAKCLAKATTLPEAKELFEWIGTLEMTGIPQISVKGSDFDFLKCLVDYDDQEVQNLDPLKNTINLGAIAEYIDDDGLRRLSAIDKTNFEDNIKTIFSKDEVTCCLGLGQEIKSGESANLCCTGYVNPKTSKCALPDYANVSLYFNRYVSSEGKGLSDNSYDAITGKMIDPSLVVQMACSKKACASGYLQYGVALSYLKIPGLEQKTKTIRRYVDNNSEASNHENIADYYDAGLRWNTDVYCFPNTSIDLGETANFNLIKCGD